MLRGTVLAIERSIQDHSLGAEDERARCYCCARVGRHGEPRALEQLHTVEQILKQAAQAASHAQRHEHIVCEAKHVGGDVRCARWQRVTLRGAASQTRHEPGARVTQIKSGRQGVQRSVMGGQTHAAARARSQAFPLRQEMDEIRASS